MKKLTLVLGLVMLAFSLPSFASTVCALPPATETSRGTAATCNLPTLETNQCVAYHLLYQYDSSAATAFSAKLNDSLVFPVTSTPPPPGAGTNVFEVRGEFCNGADTSAQFLLNSPIFQNSQVVSGPSGGSVAEDTSIPSVLAFSINGQRGFGDILFLGGSVEIK